MVTTLINSFVTDSKVGALTIKMIKYPSTVQGKFTVTKFVSVEKKNSFAKVVQSSKYEIPWATYMSLLIIFQTGDVTDIGNIMSLVSACGGIYLSIMYFICYTLYAVPIIALDLILGAIGKCGFLRLWDIGPALKGVGYMILTILIISGVQNSIIATYVLLYLFDMTDLNIGWLSCEFKQATKDCVVFSATRINVTELKPCCPIVDWKGCDPNYEYRTQLQLSILQYYRYKLKGYSPSGTLDWALFSVQLENIIASLFIWSCVTFITIVGSVPNVCKHVRNCSGAALLILLGIFVLFSIESVPTNRRNIKQHESKSFRWKVGLSMIYRQICSKVAPGKFIVLGSLAPQGGMPGGDAMISSMAFMAMIILSCLLYNFAMNAILQLINISDPDCIVESGDEFLLTIIPLALMSHLPLAKFFLALYFLALFMMSACSVLITIFCIVESIMDLKCGLEQYRMHLCCLIGIFCYSLSTLLFSPLADHLFRLWLEHIEPLGYNIIMSCYIILVIVVYSVYRLENDIAVIYNNIGVPIFIKSCWRFLPFTCVLSSILTVWTFSEMRRHIEAMRLSQIIVFLLIAQILPIVILAINHYIRNVKTISFRNLIRLFKSSKKWGPPDRKTRQIRQRFNPKTSINYKNKTQFCRHKCLLSSKKIHLHLKRIQDMKIKLQKDTHLINMAQSAHITVVPHNY